MANYRLCPVSLGLSLGITWGVGVFIMGLIAYAYSYGQPFVAAVGQLYIGYAPTLLGSVIGGLIGFVDAFIGGFIIAFLYNAFCNCKCKKGEKCE